ncbi:MAG: hypothetical protein CVT88_01675 [Candidatus Altiarchaeales archaeon HGW-Altiarchaeales-1]|nr:MAG: hypothetical protein CVT88_01675 [Candidatus Altiarchaeales archaeon HGW-Altiarchaeales-1]
MQKSITVEVEPDVLKWVIKSSGWEFEELSRKLKVSSEVMKSWINKTKKPTVKQLEHLSKIVKRPFAVFLLSKVPDDKPLPNDYRMIPGKTAVYDKVTLLSLRRARRFQNVGKYLSENIRSDIVSHVEKYKLSDDPKDAAQKYRKIFNYTKVPGDARRTFNYLRGVIEQNNIIVFQMRMPMEDVRGFTLVDELPSVIVVNSAEPIEPRTFTLMHEFGHVLIKESGVSMPENSLSLFNMHPVEKWCNEFAAEFLLPFSIVQAIYTEYKKSVLETDVIEKLKNKYKVSKLMLLYNMSRYNFITMNEFKSFLERPYAKKTEKKLKKEGEFRSPPGDKKCFSEKGRKFVSLVTNNLESGKITTGDALDYLSIKLKNLDNVIIQMKNE